MAKKIDLSEGLPSNVEVERLVLGSIMLNDARWPEVSTLKADDFSMEKHRRIFTRMGELHDRGEHVDRITVANELMRYNELQSVDGLTYLVSLDDGLPEIINLDSYVHIVREKAVARQFIFTQQHGMNQMLMGDAQVDQIINGTVERLLGLAHVSSSRNEFASAEQIIEAAGGPEGLFSATVKGGVSTPYPHLNRLIGCFKRQDLIVLAARPSMGKTALALQLGMHAAIQHEEPVGIVSLEMSRETLLQRAICTRARISSERVRDGLLLADDRYKLMRATAEVMRAPLYISDAMDGVSLGAVQGKFKQLKERHGLKFGVIDYLQLMEGPKSESRQQEVSALSRGFKLMAKDLDIPLLVLSQLSRAPETRRTDHRPILSDLRESGAIEQDADTVMFIFREEVYKPDRDDLKGHAELLLSKQRNGPIGMVKLVFLSEFTAFYSRAEDLDGAPPPEWSQQ